MTTLSEWFSGSWPILLLVIVLAVVLLAALVALLWQLLELFVFVPRRRTRESHLRFPAHLRFPNRALVPTTDARFDHRLEALAQTWFALMQAGMDPDHEPTQADMDYLSGLNDELEDFARLVARGRA